MRSNSRAIDNSDESTPVGNRRTLDFDRWLVAANDDNARPFSCLKDVIEERLQPGHCEIHLEQEADFCRVRSRTHGKLDELKIHSPSLIADLLKQLHCVSGQVHSANSKLITGEFITGTTIIGQRCRLEASYYPTENGSNLTLQIVDVDSLPETLDQLTLPADTVDLIRQHFQCTARGITLISGTDIQQLQMLYYALLGETNTVEDKIISLERYVSKPYSRINQIRLNDNTGEIANLATRHADRVFVDCTSAKQKTVVANLVSDRKPASLLLCAANSADAIRQLLDAGINANDLTSALSAIVEIGSSSAICPHCADTHTPTSRELAWLDEHSIVDRQSATDVFVHANGCQKCNHTGRDKTLQFASLVKRSDAIAAAVASRSSNTIQSTLQRALGKHSVSYQIESAVRTGKSSFIEFLRR